MSIDEIKENLRLSLPDNLILQDVRIYEKDQYVKIRGQTKTQAVTLTYFYEATPDMINVDTMGINEDGFSGDYYLSDLKKLFEEKRPEDAV